MSRFIACCILATLTLSCTTNPPDTLAAIEGEAEHAYDVALIENYALLSASAQTLDAMWRDGNWRATVERPGRFGHGQSMTIGIFGDVEPVSDPGSQEFRDKIAAVTTTFDSYVAQFKASLG